MVNNVIGFIGSERSRDNVNEERQTIVREL